MRGYMRVYGGEAQQSAAAPAGHRWDENTCRGSRGAYTGVSAVLIGRAGGAPRRTVADASVYGLSIGACQFDATRRGRGRGIPCQCGRKSCDGECCAATRARCQGCGGGRFAAPRAFHGTAGRAESARPLFAWDTGGLAEAQSAPPPPGKPLHVMTTSDHFSTL